MDACVKEAGRLHPAVGLPLERVVPAKGAEICGKRFPPGTIVGINAWVVHRDKDAFGDDAAVWRPERWLCAEQHRHKMERALLTVSSNLVLLAQSPCLHIFDAAFSSVLVIEHV